MKTPEDEAFDELAKKQGAWGGGYQAKKAMAADKLQEPVSEALKLALEALESLYISPFTMPDNPIGTAITAIKAALAQPAHSEWNAALDEAAAHIGEIKGFGQATQDSFAVYIRNLKM